MGLYREYKFNPRIHSWMNLCFEQIGSNELVRQSHLPHLFLKMVTWLLPWTHHILPTNAIIQTLTSILALMDLPCKVHVHFVPSNQVRMTCMTNAYSYNKNILWWVSGEEINVIQSQLLMSIILCMCHAHSPHFSLFLCLLHSLFSLICLMSTCVLSGSLSRYELHGDESF